MRLDEVREELRRRPFRPFRLFVSEGATYDVRHPELCVAGVHSVFVGFPSAEVAAPAFDRYALVSLTHITRIEPIEAAMPQN